ncbi:hypothetical protein BSK66_31855 [Paenibacillus odorifer]|uniref:Uncharacterized protein n=1 Tax=Paenibacillus odorifer TaxID=189426 RepID=A0AB36J835_9BACL|nr:MULTISPECIES: hypothetical protein [Paenibacillus]ETT61032.1 hypothetical protein C171_13470 [Paenibacillus sp. FSL H8-237]OMD13706.1 hypothetical protein BJP47_24060 [Paenibacillus odorifer]OME07443.1 hypothetical protein BSK60_31465 [Paenibacillus odorifer]OME10268.1 hypothetical protein BSK47_31095 [Paenibacillus odorifer]OME46564.1 hypothetical protein BSK66_31855 [Paenibacillus odorifer]
MAENPCPVYGNGHHMKPSGLSPRVVDQNGNNVSELAGGSKYECTGCHEYMIVAGKPDYGPGWAVDHYVTQGGVISAQGQAGVWVFTINRSYLRYTSASTLPGYLFVY